MRKDISLYIVILLFSYILLIPYLSQAAPPYAIDHSVKRAMDAADEKAKEAERELAQAQKRMQLVSGYYNKGKQLYHAKRYKEAIGYFEEVLSVDPEHDPAKLYLESSIMQQRLVDIRKDIEGIKLKMADIIAEYEKRRKRMGSLAVKYFLEQAQNKCQLGDFKGAEKLYSLCYKVYPYSEDKIEWFVKATHDMVKLYNQLEEENKKIEELSIPGSGL